MDLQNQLDRLEQYVADTRAAGHAAAAVTHQYLKQRIDRTQAGTDRRLDDAKQRRQARCLP
jgi:hypothetical protein